MSRRAWWAFAVMSVTWGASYLLIKIGILKRSVFCGARALMRSHQASPVFRGISGAVWAQNTRV
jgi:hypothetical protein